MLLLLLRNAYRHRLRTVLLQAGLAVSIAAFGLLRTVTDAWYAGPQATSGVRLITRSKVSMVATLPLAYAERIRTIRGVTNISWRNWFGGVQADRSHYFAQFAVDAPSNFALFPELRISPAQRQAFIDDRNGAVIGRKLSEQYGWKFGDVIALTGTFYPGDWHFTVRGIYDGAEANTDERQMFIHWQRVADDVRRYAPTQADQVGVFVVGIRDAADAARIAAEIDAQFFNSSNETLSQTEQSFKLGIVAMSDTILRGIDVISVAVMLIILLVMTNTMSLTARERLREYATLKALGFTPGFVRRLLIGEGMLVALIGGAFGMAITFPLTRFFGNHVPLFPVFVLSRQTLWTQAALSALVSVAGTLWPAWAVSNGRIVDGLRHAG